jgi:hypothetical protein
MLSQAIAGGVAMLLWIAGKMRHVLPFGEFVLFAIVLWLQYRWMKWRWERSQGKRDEESELPSIFSEKK